MKVNVASVRKRLGKLSNTLDLPLVIPRWEWYNPNFFYFTGYDVDHCIALIDGKELTIFTGKLNESLCREIYSDVAEIIAFTRISDVKKRIKQRVLIDTSYIPYSVYRRLHTKGMKPLGKELAEIREVKEREEIKQMRAARRETVDILESVRVNGRSESSIKCDILTEISKRNRKEAFETIVASSRNARFPHYKPGNALIKDYALIDMGVMHEHYNADITRCIGKLGEMESTYKALMNASCEVADAAYAEREIGDFIVEVGKILKRNSLVGFPHGIGHGIGLEVHELPSLGKGVKGVLKENSVITIEPGQYSNKGVRYEDMYLIGKKGAKRL